MPEVDNGPIGHRWHAKGGANSPFGAPKDSAFDVNLPWGSPGRAQTFANGQIVHSPNQGPGMTVAAYAQGNLAVFEWGPTDPFHYDSWIVRWSITGTGFPNPPDGQEDVPLNAPGRTRTSGFFHTAIPDNIAGSDGKRVSANFIVEGWDGDARQGWTCPIFVRL